MSWFAPILPVGRAPVKEVRRVCFDESDQEEERRKERMRRNWKRWYRKNAERKRAYQEKWRAENWEKTLAMQRRWNDKNRTWKRLTQRLWAQKKRAENIAKGLTARGEPRKLVNRSHFKKGWRTA